MTDPVRDEQLERERDFYRQQGAAKERDAIVEIVERIMRSYRPLSGEYEALEDVVGIIKRGRK